MFWLILSVFGIISGITTVLFGFGGGFVAVPLLFTLISLAFAPDSFIAQSAMHIAVATSTTAMIFGAGLATYRRHRAGQLSLSVVKPLLLPIALGAIAGAVAAVASHGSWIRWVFIAYLGLTILDALFRPGFMRVPAGQFQPLSARANLAAGFALGLIAAFLGVGGSVLSVPLMRRRGAAMSQASALANPLSLPMAVTASAVYLVLAWQSPPLGWGFIGYIYLPALAILVGGSWLGIHLATPWLKNISDSVHARAYISLLILMFFIMLVI